MSRPVKKIFLFCTIILLINPGINSQSGRSSVTLSAIPTVSGENIRIFTDRSIYCVNEKIYFTTEYTCLTELDSLTWSSVLYVELIKWNGTKLVQMKLKLTELSTSGSFEIPANILSGNYYLRAYTKWMRNFSTHDYAYLQVKIVNPFRSETDEGPIEKFHLAEPSTPNNPQINMADGIICSMDKKEYKPGDSVKVNLNINSQKLFEPGNYCISVARVGAIDTTFQFFEPESDTTENKFSGIDYLPEIRGITISGKVIEKSTKLPQKDLLVTLSETQDGEYFSVYNTIDQGRFVFSLTDIYGQRDFFIQTDKPSEINIDNDFCNRPVRLPYHPFILNKGENDFVKEMVINFQLTDKFLPTSDSLKFSQHSDSESIAFYGNKKTVYVTEKYIELPNIEEFINEIILEAEIINQKGKTFLMMRNRTNLSNIQPLILVDNVQVNNDDKLLKTPLNKIERVEVVDNGYIVAGMIYSGIISIHSKNKDFAGMDLNRYSTFFTYSLLSDQDQSHNYIKASSDSRIPDRRNILYWNPDIQLSTNKQTTVSFQTSDNKGDYVVYVRGKNSKNDSEIFGECYFSVK